MPEKAASPLHFSTDNAEKNLLHRSAEGRDQDASESSPDSREQAAAGDAAMAGMDAESRAQALPYRLESVANRRQQAVFVVMQFVFLAALLWLSITILTIFLSQFVSASTISIVLVIYCLFVIFWQMTYLYRMLAMKRAVLVDKTVPAGMRIAMATTIVPSREFDLLQGKLEGMAQVDPCGNFVDHWVLDEEDDPRVRSMIMEFNHRYRDNGVHFFHFTRKGTTRYNEAPSGRRFKCFQTRQKGGNVNAWLDATQADGYDLITIMDLDHVPRASFYRSVLPYFRDCEVAFVQGPESFWNRDQNFVTRAASYERDTFFGLIHRSYFGIGMPVVIGSHTTFRAETFHALGGYYPVHLTEDYLMMLRLRALGKHGIFVDQVLAVGELPSTWTGYLGQQQRWATGGIDLLLRYFPAMWRSYSGKEKLFTFVQLNYYVWGTFFMLSQVVLFALLLSGLELRLDGALIAGIVAFTIVAMIANYLWERQFFIERSQRSYLIESAVMNNFLGGLYFLSLLKAVIRPNMPFIVTAKSGAQVSGRPPLLSYPRAVAIFLSLEIVGLVTVWTNAYASSALHGSSGYDILEFPLVLSALANLFILGAFRRHERASAIMQPASRIIGSEVAASSRRE